MGDPIHSEVSSATEKDPSSCLLRKRLGLGEGEKGHPLLWVPCVGSARPPTAVLRHVGSGVALSVQEKKIGGDGGVEVQRRQLNAHRVRAG